jgi:glutaredoxin
MHAHSKAPNKTAIPQVFLNGTFKGVASEIEEWNEFGELKDNLSA